MITARLTKNKFEIEIFHRGEKIEVEDAQLTYSGKRQLLTITTGDFRLLPESRCPERNRFESIMKAFGDEAAVARLQPSCSLIKLNAKACDGCKDRPI